MVLGNSMSVLLNLEVDISELSKLKAARAQMEKFEKKASKAGAVAGAGMEKAGEGARDLSGRVGQGNVQLKRMSIRTRETSNRLRMLRRVAATTAATTVGAFRAVRGAVTKATAKIQALTASLQGAKMAMLGLMFTSLNMVFIFGGILALSPRIRAGLMAVAGALRLIAIEAGEILFPHLMNLAEAIRNLDEDQRELIATIAVVGTVLSLAGVLIGAFGQAFLSVVGIIRTFGSVISTIAGIVGVSSGTIVLALGSVIAAAGLLAAAFEKGGGSISKLIKTIMTKAKPILNSLASAFRKMAGEVIKLIGKMLEISGGFVSKFSSLISGVLRPVLKAMGAQFIITINLVINAITALAKNSRTLMSAVADFAIRGANSFINAWNEMVAKVVPILNSLIRKFNDLAAEMPGLDPISLVDEETVQAGKLQKEVDNAVKQANKSLDEDLISMADVLAGDEAAKQVEAFNEIINQVFSGENIDKVGKGLENIGEGAQNLGNQILSENVSQQGRTGQQPLFFPQRQGGKSIKVENQISMENQISEEIDVDRMIDKVNEELQRTTKRSGFNL